MNLPRHIARRYLFAPKSHSVINLIAGLRKRFADF